MVVIISGVIRIPLLFSALLSYERLLKSDVPAVWLQSRRSHASHIAGGFYDRSFLLLRGYINERMVVNLYGLSVWFPQNCIITPRQKLSRYFAPTPYKFF